MAENDKKIDVIYVPSVDDRKLEETLRFSILISYFDTDYYQNHYTSCERVFETINKELHSSPPYSRKQTAGDSKQLRDRCKEDVNYALYLLFNRTSIPYSHSYDKNKRLFNIVEPKYYYDYFPLTIRKYLPEHPKMLNHRVHLGHRNSIIQVRLHKMNNRVYTLCYTWCNKNTLKYRRHTMYTLILSLKQN